MVEPAASLVLNSILAARNSAARSSSPHSSLKMLSVGPMYPFPSHFFTPNPRRSKGKARACPEDLSLLYLRCSRPMLSGTAGNASFETNYVVPESSSSYPSLGAPSQLGSYRPSQSASPCTLSSAHRRCSAPPRYLKWAETDQRRHASSATSEKLSPSIMRAKAATRLVDTFPVSVDNINSHTLAKETSFDPEEAWNAFLASEACDAIKAVHFDGLVSVVRRIGSDCQQYYCKPSGSDSLALWGERIQIVLDFLEMRVWERSPRELSLQSLRARSFAMLGRFEEASKLLQGLHNTDCPHLDYTHLVETYQEFLLAMQHFHGSVHAFDWLTTKWTFFSPYLSSRRVHRRANHRSVDALRKTVLEVVDTIDFPVVYLTDRRDEWSKDRIRIAAEYLVQALCELHLPTEALSVVDEMQRQSLIPPLHLQLILIKALVREKSFELANTLYSTLWNTLGSGSPSKELLSAGLYVFAHQGDVKHAKERFDIINQLHSLSPGDIALMLHATAVNGQTAETVKVFERYFPLDESETGLVSYRPTVVHLSEVIFAHAQRSDFDGMTTWLEKMTSYGHVPDRLVYSMVMKSFAMRGDVESVSTIVSQMRTAGLCPTRFDYTTTISLLAQRKDPIGAEALYKHALEDGVVPDRAMVNALMHAHVESGSWEGVVRAFDYMMSSSNRRLRPSIAVLNTLLKAYVLIGAPFHVISNIFSKLEGVGVRPTARTFALLIQSACDAGRMDVASELFTEMNTLAQRWQSSLHINVYVLTIIMGGYLRQGHKQRAREIYNEMWNRGIPPSSVTLSLILQAYGNDKTEESWKLAEDFLRDLLREDPSKRRWDQPSGARRSALETIYHPLMSVYAQEQRPEDVERLFNDMLEAGDEPSLGTLTVLLDAYRRAGNVEAARQVWPQIFRLGLEHSQSASLTGENSTSQSPRQSNILCIPLSIYIYTLSAGGYHVDIANTWRALQINGFAFDSHNWNHLSVALVRAGQPERAFEVLERVILPYQRQTDLMFDTRDRRPNTPLTFDLPFTVDNSSLPEPQVESPMHRTERRIQTVAKATTELRDSLCKEKNNTGDFAYPLHVLHRIAPSWSTWKPHAVTLSVLSKVISQLSSGKVIERLKPNDDPGASRAVDDEVTICTKRELAAGTLRRIYTDFPDAVRAVEHHDLRERGLTAQQLEFDRQQDIIWT